MFGLQPDLLLVLVPAGAVARFGSCVPRNLPAGHRDGDGVLHRLHRQGHRAAARGGTWPGATRCVALVSSSGIALAIGAALLGGTLFPQAAEAAGRALTAALPSVGLRSALMAILRRNGARCRCCQMADD